MAQTKILLEYSDFTNIFTSNLANKLLENITMNKYVIELVNSKQLSHGPIYSYSLVELGTLKI